MYLAEGLHSYSILENGKYIFSAIYDKRSEETLLFAHGNELVGKGFTIYPQKFQFIPDYFIDLSKETSSKIIIKTKSLFFQTKQFSFEGSDYLIFRHIGTKFSFFKDKKQVASYQTYNFASGSGRMILLCDDNLCKSLFSLLCLHLFSNFGNERTIVNSPINIWFQAKRSDKNWRPNLEV